MTEVAYDRHTGKETLGMLEEITHLYVDVHSEPRYGSSPIFSRPSFIQRTQAQITRTGFELVTANTNETLIGFSFGYTIPPDSWWKAATPPRDDLMRASKFAVIELDVQSSYRGQGIGKKLLEILLNERHEEFATLTAMPNAPAYGMYIRWGWKKVGETTDGPPMDVLLMPLSGA